MRQTQTARKDAMPHEPGFKACAPFRILIRRPRRSQLLVSARFASHSTLATQPAGLVPVSR